MKDSQARKLARKGLPIRQVAALPFRENSEGSLEVMLVTSRETLRFVIPKGWPMKGLPDWKAAAMEAKQEAGLIGNVGKKPIGTYRYWKRLERMFVPVTVSVFGLQVQLEKKRWREMAQRQRRWLTVTDAATLIDEPELSALIADFGIE